MHLNEYSVCEGIRIHKILTETLHFTRDVSTKGKILTVVIIFFKKKSLST